MDFKKHIENITNIDDFWDVLSDISDNIHAKTDHSYRKKNGIYYTAISLARYMIDEIFEFSALDIISLHKYKFLEPCVGIGIFVFTFLDRIKNLVKKEDYVTLLNNIYVSDVDESAIKTYSLLLNKYAEIQFGISLTPEYFETHTSGALLFSLESNEANYISLQDVFPDLNYVDIIITNPPYRNLKAEKNKYSNSIDFDKDKDLFKHISNLSKTLFPLNKGVLNIYKLFVEEIFEKYTSDKAVVSLLIPNTIFTDRTCDKLRNTLFVKNKLLSTNIVSENNTFFDGTQTLASLLFVKGKPTTKFRVCTNLKLKDEIIYNQINYITSSLNKGTNSIIFINEHDSKILDILNTFPKIKDLDFVVNARGELDLTANKAYIQKTKTIFPLLRGRNLSIFNLNKDDILDFANESFYTFSSKREYISSERIACQQISNINKNKRIMFTYIPENYILGNSCNFISVKGNKYEIDLYYILGLMNSSVINWYFKLHSSNNHVNNYDIDNFPIAINHISDIRELSSWVKKHIFENPLDSIVEKIDLIVHRMFGLKTLNTYSKTPTKNTPNYINAFITDLEKITNLKISPKDAKLIIDNDKNYDSIITLKIETPSKLITQYIDNLVNKYRLLKQYKLLNHNSFKLSSLDLEMIETVPQGGNWKDIRSAVIEKSKRLKRITQTGGRTTLYGRINYDEPSYTITTYFNRPGNGTYVHPIHDRVISSREAARLQSFSDDYFFCGNQSNILNQIGNAVPPLLSYAFGKKILENLEVKTSVDLFAGAGGMTSGLKQAGIESLLGVDFDEKACVTLQVNNPEMHVINGDLTLDSTKNEINSFLENYDVDLVCGGPPCQGFSHAGKRFVDDPRNKLFKEFVDVINNVKPKVLIMENVEGLKTMQNGLVYMEVLKSFQELGYNVEGQTLMASDYGVPQKRKRVFIIGVRNDINISPTMLFPDKLNYSVTARDAIEDLETIENNQKEEYNSSIQSKYVKFLRKSLNNLEL